MVIEPTYRCYSEVVVVDKVSFFTLGARPSEDNLEQHRLLLLTLLVLISNRSIVINLYLILLFTMIVYAMRYGLILSFA